MKSVKNFVCILHLFNDLIIMHNKNPNRDFWEAIYKINISLRFVWVVPDIKIKFTVQESHFKNIIIAKTKWNCYYFCLAVKAMKVCDFNDRIVNPSFLIKHTEFEEEN